jgi:DNA-directed RNA polymerase subunit beta
MKRKLFITVEEDLLKIQKESFLKFAGLKSLEDYELLPRDKRKDSGIFNALSRIFGEDGIELEHEEGIIVFKPVDYKLSLPKYTPGECLRYGLTFCSTFEVVFNIEIWDKDEKEGTKKGDKPREEIQQEVYLCDLPLMTKDGDFIINGVRRVIVNQLYHSPGVIVEESEEGELSKYAKRMCVGKIIPYRGAYIEFGFGKDNDLFARINRERGKKIPVSVFLRALGYTNNSEILRLFYTPEEVDIEEFVREKEKYNGSVIVDDIIDEETGEIVVEGGTWVFKEENIEGELVPERTKELERAVKEKSLFSVITFSEIEQYCGKVRRRLPVVRDEKIFFETFSKEKKLVKSYEEKPELIKKHAMRLVYLSQKDLLYIRPSLEENYIGRLFFNPNRYSLGSIGRLRINRKLRDFFPNIPSERDYTLTKEDFIALIRYVMSINLYNKGEMDDIDHLENRRVRSVGEFLEDILFESFMYMMRQARDKIATLSIKNCTPRNLFSTLQLSNNLKTFFSGSKQGSSSLSQFLDEVNPLSSLTHKRRLSVLGPQGVTRRQAGFEVRDIHYTHFGRVCPIETPEGQNIGLITSLTCLAHVNEYGMLETPCYKVENGKVNLDKIEYITADKDDEVPIAPADTPIDEDGNFKQALVPCRYKGGIVYKKPKEIGYRDVSPLQLVSVSAALIPFLEHDDINRVLMGANMERQAIHILKPEPPLCMTGLERKVSVDSGAVICAKEAGKVIYVSGSEILIEEEVNIATADGEELVLDSLNRLENVKIYFIGEQVVVESGERRQGQELETGFVMLSVDNKKKSKFTVVHNFGDRYKPEEIEFDVAKNKEKTIGERVVVSFEKDENVFTIYNSIKELFYILHFEASDRLAIKDIKKVRRYPLVRYHGTNQYTCVDYRPVVHSGEKVKKGAVIADGPCTSNGYLSLGRNVLVAFMSWEGTNFEDAILVSERLVKEDIFTSLSIREFETDVVETKLGPEEITRDLPSVPSESLKNLDEEGIVYNGAEVGPGDILVGKVAPREEEPVTPEERLLRVIFGKKSEIPLNTSLEVPPGLYGKVAEIDRYCFKSKKGKNENEKEKEIYKNEMIKITKNIEDDILRNIKKAILRYSQEKEKIKENLLPLGVREKVKVRIISRYKLQVGDKLANRHGNKGVIAKILPVEDMPYLPDGTPVDVVISPLSVPSRMNVGQLFECMLGWAAKMCERPELSPVFLGGLGEDGKDSGSVSSEERVTKRVREVREYLIKEKNVSPKYLPDDYCRITLYDGRTGEPFKEKVTVGYMYIMKLVHLVEDKIHARSTGQYSLVTQQPLGGKARFGGQRLGEMEVWALEAYGASHLLHEFLTAKSDDDESRQLVYTKIVSGKPIQYRGIPGAFKVLVHELRSLGLNVQLLKEKEEEKVIK